MGIPGFWGAPTSAEEILDRSVRKPHQEQQHRPCGAGHTRGTGGETEFIELSLPTLSLRALISQVVENEVARFKDRQAENRLLRVLSKEQIADGVERGRVFTGGSDLDQRVDRGTAVATAIEAFEDGFYFVFLDDRQAEGLDAELPPMDDSTLLFVRLVPLVGG